MNAFRTIVISAAAVTAASQAVQAAVGAGVMLEARPTDGVFAAEIADGMSRSQSQAEIRRDFRGIITSIRLSGATLAEQYIDLAQTYLDDSGIVDPAFDNCYSNCHSACHGSRGWR
jgi:hypothetical protein